VGEPKELELAVLLLMLRWCMGEASRALRSSYPKRIKMFPIFTDIPHNIYYSFKIYKTEQTFKVF